MKTMMGKLRTSLLVTAITILVAAVTAVAFILGFGANTVAPVDTGMTATAGSLNDLPSNHAHSNPYTGGAFPSSGTYYLTGDITDAAIKIVGMDITLCLNGHSIIHSEAYSAIHDDYECSVIVVGDEGAAHTTLTLCDCNPNSNILHCGYSNCGIIKVTNDTTFNMYGGTLNGNYCSDEGGGVYVEGAATFNMYGGTISNNHAGAYGGGVYVVEGSKFNMYGGTIKGNDADSGAGVYVDGDNTAFVMEGGTIGGTSNQDGNMASSGGGVYVIYGAAFTMKAGTISGNNVSGDGAGVCVSYSGTFTMESGIISNNRADGGGGVLVDTDGIFTMENGTISDNTCSIGGAGGVLVDGTFEMSGGSICDNKAPDAGGAGVIISANAIFTMSGDATISGNIGAWQGGGVIVNSGATFNMTENAVITDNTAQSTGGGGIYLAADDAKFNMTGGTINNNHVDYGNGGGVYGLGIVTVGGTAVISGNDGENLYLPTGKTITISTTTPLASGASIGVTLASGTGAITSGNGGANTKSYFTSDNDAYSVTLDKDSGEVVIAEVEPVASVTVGSDTTEYATIEDAFDYANGKTATITLLVDEVASDSSLTIDSGEVTLDLDGKTLTIGGRINLSGGAQFTLKDDIGGGKLVGGFMVGGTSTTLTMESGVMDANVGNNGIVYLVPGGKFTMNGGTITGNHATDGGAVWVGGGSATFEMNGGTITGNSATRGGGVYVFTGGIFNMTAGTISGNTAAEGGGVFSKGTFNLSGGTISGNSVEYVGGGACVDSGTFSMSDGTISGNTADTNGGGVYVGSDANFTMTGGTITGNEATNEAPNNGEYVFGRGGGVYIGTNGKFIMDGGNITDNTANTTGGGVCAGWDNVDNINSMFIMNSGTISGNTATTGGGVWVGGPNSTFTMEGGTISSNSSNGAGGGVYIHVVGTFTMNDGTITENNSGYNGGGVVVDDNATFTMNGGTISDNTATQNGGGVRNKGTFNMAGGTISGNSTTVGGGGGVHNVGTFTMTDGTIGGDTEDDKNTAQHGGGVYVDENGTFTMDGGTISGNNAQRVDNVAYSGYGGGVFVVENSTFTMINGEISGNTAASGGGVRNVGTFNMDGGTISDNAATDGLGGGVYNAGTFTMKNGSIDNNESSWTGGGVRNDGVFIMKNGTISGNETKGSGGGGVCSSGTFTMDGGTISGNYTATGGGGVDLYNGSTFTMSGGKITGNTATENGGGVRDYDGSKFTMTGGTISDNIASINGGGVHVHNADTVFKISGTAKVFRNKVGSAVNNVYLSNNKLITVADTLTDALIGITFQTEGVATSGFGANNTGGPSRYFFLDSAAKTATLNADKEVVFTVINVASVTVGSTTTQYTSIKAAFDYANGKTATIKLLNGGVPASEILNVSSGDVTLDLDGKLLNLNARNIRVTGGKFTLKDGADNTKNNGGMVIGGGEVNGGGVYVNAGTFIMNNGTISLNKASSGGGGVFVNAGIFNMNNGTIKDNEATVNGGGVGIYKNTAKFTMAGGTISGNTAENGGGVQVNSATFEMSAGTISGNTAKWGGGVHIHYAEFTMKNGTISNNTATSNGGGVYVYTDSTFTLEKGTISGNISRGGGGVFVNAGEFDMNGGAISGNEAIVVGGGVYVYGSGEFTMTAGTINNNTATGENDHVGGGGVYLSGEGTFKLSGTAIIKDNTIGDDSDNNVYLQSGQVIDVDEAFAEGAQIYVSLADGYTGAFTSGYGANNKDGDGNVIAPTTYFHEDNGACLHLTASGEVEVGHDLTHFERVEKCEEEGHIEYWQCSICSKKFSDADCTAEVSSVALDPVGHHFVDVVAAEPDCTTAGKIAHQDCDRCDKHFSNTQNADGSYDELTEEQWKIAALGHDKQEQVLQAATCTDSGTKKVTCSRCDYEAEETIPATGHSTVHHTRKEATCLEAGNIEYWHCNNCGKNFGDAECKQEEADVTIPTNGSHSYGAPVWVWTDYTSATATFTCSKCNDEQTVTALATPTAEKPNDKIVVYLETHATCNSTGSRTYAAYVQFNGADYYNINGTAEVLAIVDHEWTPTWNWTEDAEGNVSVTVTFTCSKRNPAHTANVTEGITVTSTTTDPDCIHKGNITYTASVEYEGEAYITTAAADKHIIEIAATGKHTYSEDYTVIQNPTCTEAGVEAHVCTTEGCDTYKGVRVVNALGHDWQATVTDGTNKTYNAFETFDLTGFAATFVCANDETHTHTFAVADGTITYATRNCLHVGDDSVSLTVALPDDDTYTYEFTGIKVNPIAATGVVWEYRSSETGATWATLDDNKTLTYDGKEYTVRVRFAKDGADDNTAANNTYVVGNEYINVFATKFKDYQDGGYTYTLAALGDYTIADSSRNVTVNKQQVTAGGDKWLGGGAELMDGSVKQVGDDYRYFPAGTDGATDVTNAVVRYVSGSVTVTYNYTGTQYTLTYTNDTTYGNTASQSGMYTAKVTLTLADTVNYEFVLATGATGATLNDDGTITVTKVWYAALCDNGFVSEISGWQFGSASAPTALPDLEKGQGTAEIKLTLKRGEVVIGSEFTPDNFTHYINSTMPVGSYTLSASVAKVTIDEFEYAAFTHNFTFTVAEADAFTVGNISDLADITDAVYDGTLHIYDSFVPSVSGLITAGTGVWADEAYADLYGSAAVSFSHATLSGHYYTYAELLLQTESTLFINAGSYVALFMIAAPNYTEVTGSFNVAIAKATFDLKDVVFSGKTETYDKDTWYSLDNITGLPTATGNGLPVGTIISVAYDGNGKQVANETGYTVTATLTLSDTTNYTFVNSADADDEHILDNGDKAVYTALLKINKATYTIDVTFADDEVDYDGNTHSLTVVWNTAKPDGVTVTYENNDQVNANETGYTVTAVFHGDTTNYNAIEDKTAKLIINKAVVDLSDVALAPATFKYDGKPHSLVLSGAPAQVDVAYSVSNVTEEGSYPVTATLSLKAAYAGNYKFADDAVLSYSANLTITAFEFDMTKVQFVGKTVTYTGNAYSLFITGTLPSGVTYAYENNNCVEAGTHTVTVHFYHNLGSNFADIEDMTAELIILKADYDLNVTFPGATFTYDGNAHSLSIRGMLPSGVTYSYENNSLTEVGSQLVTVKFVGDTQNYNPIPNMTATLKVVPASLGITNVSLESKTLDYDGNTHSLSVNGDLPEGVTVKYFYIDENGEEVEFTGAMDAGTYKVVAKFELPSENYKAIRPLNATLTIVKTDTPVKPPVVVEPTVEEVEASIVPTPDYDQVVPTVEGEITQHEDFPYWIVAVAIIGAEVLAMAIMGLYIAFWMPKRKKK